VTVAVLLVLVAWGASSYFRQVKYGLGVTGMAEPVSWGLYITNFVFFIGISHAGTLISAILRLTQAEWRRPITRMAEVITVAVLFIGAGFVLIDLGRPDRMMNVLLFGRYQSPLLWDATSISSYLTGSTLYLYLPLIPDIAILRDRGKRWNFLFRVLAMGWQGTTRQQKILNRAIAIMAVLVIPIAVSVHTVVSFVFSMTLQPGWHSTIFGPYFVVGAIFSGIAMLMIVMVILRKAFKLESYLKEIHFRNLSLLLLVMSLLWFYFTFAEYLTGFYGNEPEEMSVFWDKFSGQYGFHFWLMVIFNFVVPIIILGNRKTRTIMGALIASITISIGMWLERFLIIVPTLMNPRLEYTRGFYSPTLTEWSITIAGFALFALFYVVFTKFFPIISAWEVKEGREEGLEEVDHRVRSYLPDYGNLSETR
jgi:molybdopterin-containing oxidoreductase family membrane subunit